MNPSPSRELADRIAAFWLAPGEAARVRAFERLFTATFLLWMGRSILNWREWLTRDGFHLDTDELRSMGYPDPWPLLEPWQVLFLAAIMVTAATLVLTREDGWRRAGLVTLFLCALMVQRIDFMAAFTLNKLYVAVFALLAIGPAMWRDAGSGTLWQSRALLRVLQATLILQYFAAGLAKAGGDWLDGHDILWGQVQGVYRTEAAAWALRHLPRWAWAAQQHLSLGFELLAPLLFTWRRLLPLAFVLGLGFHLVIALMMKDLIFFSVQMAAFYVLFIPPSWLENPLPRKLRNTAQG